MSDDNRKLYFHFSIFFPTLLIVIIINLISVMFLLKDFDITQMRISTIILLLLFWSVISALLTFLIRYNSLIHYEKPMKKIANAIQEVASGDFSVYVDPIHTSDRINYLDKMIMNFNKMVEELGSVETLKADFLSNVSHEIKTPLSIIQNYSELLKNDAISDAQRREYIAIVYDTTKRLSALITNILRLNKLEKQGIMLHHESYDVCEQLCACILSFENIWNTKDIEIIVEIEDRRLIPYDAYLMELVWNNILSNAIKFTPEHGCIKIQEHVENQICFISIEDNGCGMSQETQQHIFEKFYQGDTSHATQGNGLGLTLANRVLQLSGADISVTSELEKGTVFLVKLPLYEEEEVNK